MEDIRESIIYVMNVSKHQKIVSDLAKKIFDDWKFSKDYYKKFGKSEFVWTEYGGFTILNERTIRIQFKHGIEDNDVYNIEEMIIDLTPYIRDTNIEKILK